MLNTLSNIDLELAAEPFTDTTVAVLPFNNLSDNNQLNHICAGFTLDLITDLSRFRSFNIISSKTTELLTPDEDTQSELIRQLQTDYLVKGTFRHFEGKVRINTQLISTQPQRLVWAENFEDALENIFSMQETILQKIVNALQHHLNHDIVMVYKKKPVASLNAFTCWVLGMNELKKGTLDADIAARNYFKQALETDPTYSRAFTGLSLSYFNEWSCQIWDRWEVSQKGAFRYARKAIELDDQDYISAMVLGRVYMYDGDYETAEYYLRRSLQLNPNDTDNLIQVATCLTLLGYAEEALGLYERAYHLNPINNDAYRVYGAFIYFELGEFTKCLSLVKITPEKPGWIDMPGYIAAAWYMLGDMNKMQYYWKMFMDLYVNRINNGQAASTAEGLEWMMRINPHRGKSYIEIFWNYLKQENGIPLQAAVEAPVNAKQDNIFREEDGLWRLSFEGTEVLMPGVKGFQDIYRLMQRGGGEIHCTELMGSSPTQEGVEVIDEKAKKNYQKKILQLQEELSAAEQANHTNRIAALQEEYDQLLDHLSQSLGMGGRIRKASNPADRIRSAVTWRIRNSIRKIGKQHPALARHLDVSIRTGTFCAYAPERPVSWKL